MKAITLWQPWATFIADGLKCFETRSWETRYRGRLAIHAANRWDKEQERIFLHLRDMYPVSLIKYPEYHLRDFFPLGCMIAITELTAILPTEFIPDLLSPLERSLGNYDAGRFAWELRLVEKLAAPIRTAGRQGLWEWEP